MPKQPTPPTSQHLPFQSLPQDSPQIKPSSPLQQPQDLDLQANQKQNEQIGQLRNRRKKLKAKKTNLIKIKPVQNQHLQIPQSIEYLPEDQTQTTQQTFVKLPATNIEQSKFKQSYPQTKEQPLESPVLYRISDDEDQGQREQNIPQSSRRPLNQAKKQYKQHININEFKKQLPPIYPIQRGSSSSDQPYSPEKLLPQRKRSKNKDKSSEVSARRFNKMKKEVEKEQRQPTQVFDYDGDKDSDGEQGEANQAESEQYYSSSKQDQEYEGRGYQKQKLTKSNTPPPKPQITVFKSNSFYTLINAQIPKGNFINCIIRRKRTQEYFEKTVTYQLFLLQDKKYLMTCTKNRFFKTTSHFQFYREKTNAINYHQENLYAQMDSNFTGTQFVLKTIHRNDTNSEKSTAIDKSELLKMEQSTSVISDQLHKGPTFYASSNSLQSNLKKFQEKEMLFISFKANFFGFAGQRQVKMLKKKNKKLKQTGNFSDLRTAQQNEELDKYSQINSKKAIQGKNGLELDFKGIAKMESTKNIILEGEGGREALIFGKLKQDIYSVAIGSPLSIVEGLAFGIANLDRKFFVN